ncbi:hypothetical protein [Psychrobacillus sp. FJAT-21963]|uniref:hypothetical protein n=1 Tax=Psychrobacillus sp. FJAT-21963 TaxID=1712028 RepID=UPI0006FBE344|nr:hypothetical protein [Psychrobacillus sp. FJAT-21963]KQL36785.1 hypothetical protein AN959_01585 [Psychrobacillus sp. FJAT-21963]
MTENKSYRLYDSLEFFWRKKVWFIIIPLIAAILGYFGSMLIPKDGDYVGKSTVFTGSVKLEALTNPDHIMAKYGQHFSGKSEVFVPTRSYIKTEVYGDNEETVTKELNQFNDQLLEALMKQDDKIIAGTETYASAQSERVKTLNATIEAYKTALAGTDNLTVINNYTTLLSAAEMDLTNAMATEQRVRNDIIAFEHPELAKTSVVKTKSYGLEGAIAGLVLGLLLTIFILSLWKYILEARGSKRA